MTQGIASFMGGLSREQQLRQQVKEKIDGIKSLVNLPVGVGFGINEPDVAKKVSSLADGVIVGSKIINEIEKYHTDSSEKCIDSVKSLISSFRLAIDN